MDHQFSPEDTEIEAAERQIVYVRPIAAEDLPNEIRAQAEGLNDLHAVHTPDGERLAVVKDRKLAFALARQNNLSPVSVH
ncbi:MAG: DUF1150 family protein [Pseudomonadota bacterium]